MSGLQWDNLSVTESAPPPPRVVSTQLPLYGLPGVVSRVWSWLTLMTAMMKHSLRSVWWRSSWSTHTPSVLGTVVRSPLLCFFIARWYGGEMSVFRSLSKGVVDITIFLISSLRHKALMQLGTAHSTSLVCGSC